MSRKEERAELDALLNRVLSSWDIGYHQRLRLVTALLDNGYRNNAVVLHEAVAAMRKADPGHPAMWLRDRARELEQ